MRRPSDHPESMPHKNGVHGSGLVAVRSHFSRLSSLSCCLPLPPIVRPRLPLPVVRPRVVLCLSHNGWLYARIGRTVS